MGHFRIRRLAISFAACAAVSFAVLPYHAFAAPAFVKNVATNGSTSIGGSIAATVPAATSVAVGNTVIVAFAMDPTTGTVSCADSKLNTYQVDINVQNGSAGAGVRTVICSAPVTTGLVAGDTITVTHPTVAARAIAVSEFSGLMSTGRRDRTMTGTGTGTAPATGATLATTQADELLIGAIGAENNDNDTFTVVSGSGYTALAKDASSAGTAASNIAIFPEYRIVTATGAYIADGTLGTSARWAAAIATFKSLCGNGTIDAGEQCDDSNAANGDCCSSSCQFESAATVCRAAAGPCDLAETCPGGSATCPADVVKPDGTSCDDLLFCNGADTCNAGVCANHAGDPCTGPDGDGNCSESCNETADNCTAADPNGTACTDGLFCNGTDTCSSGTCSSHVGDPCLPLNTSDSGCAASCNETADNCSASDPNGTACNDGLFCNGTDTCSGGVCSGHAGDPCPGPDGDGNCAESCNETADNCTADDTNGSACNDGTFCNGADTCSSGVCSSHAGDPCPGPDGDGNCSESCNEAADNCTAADTNGTTCTDGLFCNGTDTCSSGTCSSHAGDPCTGGAECQNICNETVDSCNSPSGTACGSASDTVCDNADTCNGSGACQVNNEPITFTCRAAVNDCDVVEKCDGAGSCPADVLRPSGFACGDQGESLCSHPDTCSGTGVCNPNHEPSTTTCRADAGECDVVELCDGAGNCPANAFEPSGTTCGSASDTVCDNPDSCNATGTCVANNEPTSVVCRADAGACDVAENCNGAGACPADAFEPAGTACGSASDTVCDNPDTCNASGSCLSNLEPTTVVCRADAGACDVAENCDGAGNCPANLFEPAGTACGSASDTVCDNPDTCNATGTCLANNEPTTVLCRADAGECDVAENCNGAGACPADAFEPVGTGCGSASDTVCDNPDTCNAAGSCVVNNEPTTFTCRAAASDCDVAEKCDGAGACPANAFAASGASCGDPGEGVCDDADTCNGTGTCQPNHKSTSVVCRGDAGACDVAENCNGAGACPADAFEPAGTACGSASDTVCDNPDSCSATGTCLANNEPTSVVCRADAGACDVAENCNGAGACPTDAFEPAGTACGSASDTVCDNPDTCNASGSCLSNLEPTTVVCRADAGACDVAENCDGAGGCPADLFEPAGTACGSASDTVCDNPDSCNASGTCLANNEPTTVVCRADAGACDVAENCNGAGACPADAFEPAGTTCGSASDTVCDNPDSCNATGTCVANNEPTSVVCRADAGACDVAENCDGAGGCPADLFEPAGTTCGSASDTVCDNPDTCNASGSCLTNHEPSSLVCRGDAGACDVAELCDGAGNCPANVFEPSGTACGNASDTACDNPDTCNASGSCLTNNEPTTVVCRSDAGACDVAENCNGAGACPADAFEPAGTTCGSASDTVCDNPDSCNATGTCVANNEPTSVLCRADAGACDVAENCNGAGACPADAFEPSGTACGSASDTVCDNPDSCNASGSCVVNNEPNTTVCRSAVGTCDVAENCDGAGACPANGFKAAGTACGSQTDTACDNPNSCNATGTCLSNFEPTTVVCRADAGDCDVAELCNGIGGCPANSFDPAGTACGSQADTVCDNPNTCNATGTCLGNFEPTSVLCRADAGACDIAENCDGAGACPADAFEPVGTACGSASDTVCDNPDTCNASGACAVNNEPTSVVCRADAGACDAAENCNGAGACPADAFEPAGTACGSASDTVCDNPDTCNASGSCLTNNEPTSVVCRTDAGACDVAENCNGAGACPADAFEPAGTACGSASDTVCDNPDACNATGSCAANNEPTSVVCRSDAGACDVAENCNGAGACPADAFEPAGTACGSASDTACDNPDTCNASGSCLVNHEPTTTECRADAGACDVAEQCDGAGACPADSFVPAGTTCGDPADTSCDDPDSCDEAGTCLPNHEPSTTSCRPAVGQCDAAESCDGAGNCPVDVAAAAGTACGDPGDTACDNPDACDGAGTCAPNFEPSTSECRPAAGDCDEAETCTGSSSSCPADAVLPAGLDCRGAADSCETPAYCDGSSPACPDNGSLPDGTSCDDGNACTGPDVCEAGACTTTMDVDACVDNRLCYGSKFTGFAPLPVMTLIDVDTIGAVVGSPSQFCTAADRDGAGIGEPGIEMAAYKIKIAPGWPKHIRRTLRLRNDLGDISVETIKPELLLVPSAEDAPSVPPAPDFDSHGVDHYTCYKVVLTKHTAGVPKGTTTAVADLFSATARDLGVLKPRHVCIPVDRAGDGIKNHDAYLVCYGTRPVPGQPKHVPQSGLQVANPLSTLVGATTREREICLPSFRLP